MEFNFFFPNPYLLKVFSYTHGILLFFPLTSDKKVELQSEKRQHDIISEFQQFKSWEEYYRHIIKLGKSLPKLEDSLYQEKFLVKGCQSRVWFFASLNDKGEMILKADSDAMIVKGLVSLLLRLYSGLPPSEILKTKPIFIETLGLDEQLSPGRSNGFLSMVKQIKLYAQAFILTEGHG